MRQRLRQRRQRRQRRRFQDAQDAPAVWYTLAALIMVAQLADALTTSAVLRSGGDEGNRLARALFAHGAFDLVALAKLALALALAGLLVAFAAAPSLRRSRLGLVPLGAAALGLLAYALILGNNLADWLILAHALPWR
jgi:hypothetical protein